MVQEIDEAAAREIVRKAEESRAAARLEKRDADRKLAKPFHFHAVVITYESKDPVSGNFQESLHQDVWGTSPDSCIRKALNRAQPNQKVYHLQQLIECHDLEHPTREMED